MYYDVIIRSKTSFLDNTFTYKYNEEINLGSRVIVPFGRANSLTLAFVISKNEEVEESSKIKEIVEVIDTSPILTKDQLDLIHFMVDRYLSDYSAAIQTLLPPGSVDKIVEYFSLGINSSKLDEDEQSFFSRAKKFDEIEKKFAGKYTKSQLNKLVEEKILFRDYDKKAQASKRYIYNIVLEEGAILLKNAPVQQAIIDYLSENGKTEKSELLRNTNANLQSLKSLIDKEVVRVERIEDFRQVLDEDIKSDEKPILTLEQEMAYNEIISASKDKFLIHGVTGSGKTELYMRLIEHYLKEDKDAIMLVPEISLTPQTIMRFQARFGQNIAVLHSKLSISERYDQWRLIHQGKVKIVVGARSAIFAPFKNLGIIVVDEEHESSYKSEKNPKYDAIEIAMKRAELTSSKLILGTATPSVSTMYKVYKKELGLIRLNNRATNSSLPSVDIVDMSEELKMENFSMFSNLLRERMTKALEEKRQVILFLNKRGHTSFVFCRSCGYVHRCEACDVAMTYHKYNDRLVCHFCGRTNKRKRTCEACGSTYIKEFGAGTEKLEEETKMLFPNARVYRMDADTITNKADYEKVYAMMLNGQIDILIGTQMLAKGLDFPNVTVVGVMAADISLNLPDYKASEKTYQLITQVSGRAGRGEQEGFVVLQTYQPNHYAITTSSKNQYYSFFQHEITKRKRYSYPPFLNILIINFSSWDRNLAISYANNTIKDIMRFVREKGIVLKELSGPTPNVIERINNHYRFNVIVKSKEIDEVLIVGRYIKNEIEKNKDVYINFSINPDTVY